MNSEWPAPGRRRAAQNPEGAWPLIDGLGSLLNTIASDADFGRAPTHGTENTHG